MLYVSQDNGEPNSKGSTKIQVLHVCAEPTTYRRQTEKQTCKLSLGQQHHHTCSTAQTVQAGQDAAMDDAYEHMNFDFVHMSNALLSMAHFASSENLNALNPILPSKQPHDQAKQQRITVTNARHTCHFLISVTWCVVCIPWAVVCDWLVMLLSTMLWTAGKARDRFSEPAICSANSFSFTRAGNNSTLNLLLLLRETTMSQSCHIANSTSATAHQQTAAAASNI